MATFGETLKERRQAAGLSHDKLAERAGTTRSHLIKLEKGKHRPRAEMVERLAYALNVDLAVFDDGLDDEAAA